MNLDYETIRGEDRERREAHTGNHRWSWVLEVVLELMRVRLGKERNRSAGSCKGEICWGGLSLKEARGGVAWRGKAE
jgi:hypothetical protein